MNQICLIKKKKIWPKTCNTTSADTSQLAKKDDIAGLKSDFDRLDIDKLETTPLALSKLTNVVKYEVVKKSVYDELVKKVNTIDTSELVKTQIIIIR